MPPLSTSRHEQIVTDPAITYIVTRQEPTAPVSFDFSAPPVDLSTPADTPAALEPATATDRVTAQNLSSSKSAPEEIEQAITAGMLALSEVLGIRVISVKPFNELATPISTDTDTPLQPVAAVYLVKGAVRVEMADAVLESPRAIETVLNGLGTVLEPRKDQIPKAIQLKNIEDDYGVKVEAAEQEQEEAARRFNIFGKMAGLPAILVAAYIRDHIMTGRQMIPALDNTQDRVLSIVATDILALAASYFMSRAKAKNKTYSAIVTEGNEFKDASGPYFEGRLPHIGLPIAVLNAFDPKGSKLPIAQEITLGHAANNLPIRSLKGLRATIVRNSFSDVLQDFPE